MDGLALDEQGCDLAAADIDGTIGIVGDLGFEDAEGAQPFALEGDLFSGVERLFLFGDREAIFVLGFFVALLLIILHRAREPGEGGMFCRLCGGQGCLLGGGRGFLLRDDGRDQDGGCMDGGDYHV